MHNPSCIPMVAGQTNEPRVALTPNGLWFKTLMWREGPLLRATLYSISDGQPKVMNFAVDLRELSRQMSKRTELSDSDLQDPEVAGIFSDIGNAVKSVGRNKIVKGVAKAAKGVIKSKVTGGIVGAAAVIVPPVGVPAAAAYAGANAALVAVEKGEKVVNGLKNLSKNKRKDAKIKKKLKHLPPRLRTRAIRRLNAKAKRQLKQYKKRRKVAQYINTPGGRINVLQLAKRGRAVNKVLNKNRRKARAGNLDAAKNERILQIAKKARAKMKRARLARDVRLKAMGIKKSRINTPAIRRAAKVLKADRKRLKKLGIKVPKARLGRQKNDSKRMDRIRKIFGIYHKLIAKVKAKKKKLKSKKNAHPKGSATRKKLYKKFVKQKKRLRVLRLAIKHIEALPFNMKSKKKKAVIKKSDVRKGVRKAAKVFKKNRKMLKKVGVKVPPTRLLKLKSEKSQVKRANSMMRKYKKLIAKVKAKKDKLKAEKNTHPKGSATRKKLYKKVVKQKRRIKALKKAIKKAKALDLIQKIDKAKKAKSKNEFKALVIDRQGRLLPGTFLKKSLKEGFTPELAIKKGKVKRGEFVLANTA